MTRRRLLGLGGAAAAIGIGAAVGIGRGASMADYEARADSERAPLPPDPALRDLVRIATLAPNGHNTQPWLFTLGDRRIAIRPDVGRRTPVVDPDDHHLYVSLGAAAETLAIAAAAGGRPGSIAFEPAGDGAVLFDFAAGRPDASPLAGAIAARQSTRGDFDGRPVPAATLQSLADAARMPGVELILVTEPARIASIAALVIAGNTEQMQDPAFRAELKHWLRFNPGAAIAAGDGLFAGSSGNPTLPGWLGSLMFELVVSAESENAKYRSQLRTSSGLAIFVSERGDADHFVAAGRACQRFLLAATAAGLRQSFVNQPVEVPAIRRELASLLGLPADARPDLVIRFGYGPAMPRSLRRPVDAVIVAA